MENKKSDNVSRVPGMPEITTENALNLLLVSIAYEELGLTHILNAEAEKIQSILGTLKGQQIKNPQASELEKLECNVDKILKDIIKKDMLLGIKLENILSMPKPAAAGVKASNNTVSAGGNASQICPNDTGTSAYTSHTAGTYESGAAAGSCEETGGHAQALSDDLQDIPEDRVCRYSFAANGTSVVTSEEDDYFGRTVCIEDQKVCTNRGSIDNSFLKYSILADRPYVFTAIPATMHILPPSPFTPLPSPENPNVMIIMGRGSIVYGSDEDEGQFSYIIRDSGKGAHTGELHMIITADSNELLSHNSGIMNLRGELRIKRIIV